MQEKIDLKQLPKNTKNISIETDETFLFCDILATTHKKQIHILHKKLSYEQAIKLLVKYNNLQIKENN